MLTSVRKSSTARLASCLPCQGTGRELRCTSPGDVMIDACSDCDGRGVVTVPNPVARPAADPRCPECRRPVVVFEGEEICPSCVTFAPSDFN